MAQLKLDEMVVLLVEPSTTQRRIIERYLKQLGIDNPVSTGAGADALERMRAGQPDLVISAMYLPDMTGTDLVYRMREDPQLQKIAFMLISSETRFRYLDPIRQAGVISILPKPFEFEEFKIALNTAVDYLEPEAVRLREFDTEDIKVLIVDDSPFSRKHIRRVLSNMGLERFTEASDGVEALGLIENSFFDLVVTDYNMPNMDGGELVDQIRNQSSQSAVPILMVTSESNENRLAAVQQAGVSAICDKPFEAGTIRQLLESVFTHA